MITLALGRKSTSQTSVKNEDENEGEEEGELDDVAEDAICRERKNRKKTRNFDDKVDVNNVKCILSF